MPVSKLILKLSLTYLFISLLIFSLILLPRAPHYLVESQFHIEVKYSFTIEGYQAKLNEFITYIKENEGLGVAPEGIAYLELMQRYTLRSLQILLPSFFLTITLSLSYCFFAIHKRMNTTKKQKSNPFLLLFSLPDFFIFIFLQYLFIQIGNHFDIKVDVFGHDQWFHFILPAIVLSFYPMYYLSKVMLTIFTKELKKEYITTARSKGTMNNKIVHIHIFKNSIDSLLSHIFVAFIYLISSLPIIELLSAYDGLGYQLIDSIKKYDDLKAISFVIPFISLIFITKFFIDFIRFLLIGRVEKEFTLHV